MDAAELAAIKERARANSSNATQRTQVLRPPIKPRELILSYGVGGTGKSTAILEVARYCPTDTFYVFDNELYNYDRLLATEFTDLRNVDVTPCDEWYDWKKGIQKVSQNMREDDWIVIDSSTPTWDAVQAWFVEEVHGKDIDEYFLARRMMDQAAKDSGNGDNKRGFSALSGEDGDWQIINKEYFKHFYNALIKSPGHVYLTAEQAAIEKNDEKDTKAAYGGLGFRPKGQKRLGHVPMTTLWFTKHNNGFYMTTAKDRGRADQDNTPVRNFAVDYLINVAGWGLV
jgi:hypothetical protein